MKRRALLAGLAATTAGCLSEPIGQSDGNSPGGSTGTDTTTDDGSGDDTGPTDDGDDGSNTTTDDDAGDDGPDDEYDPDWRLSDDPVTTIEVGSRADVESPGDNRVWSFAFWNDTGGDASVSVTVTSSGSVVVDRTIEVPADEWVGLTLQEPSDYEVAVLVEGERRWAERYTPDSFTCNSKWTTVALGPDGAVATRTVQTELACIARGVEDSSLVAGDGDCNSGTGHEASVSFGDSTVSIDGTVMTPTPCFTLHVEQATVSDDGTLTVVIAGERADGVCVECIGAVPYDATVSMTKGAPDVVVVEHLVDGDRTVVTRTER